MSKDSQTAPLIIRQLIAGGKSRAALEAAKDFHKAEHSPFSEDLLVDAYIARIQSLLEHKLDVEAKSLMGIVRERFPSGRHRLDQVANIPLDLAAVLQPLADPQLPPDQRAAVELAVQNQMWDLSAIANCAALPPDHSLRQAAAALHSAFNLVTSGPVTDEQIALAEVSHRSPLAGWKVLIRAIAAFYRRDDAACREYLGAIKPDSVPARLIPALKAMLGDDSAAATLTKPAVTLIKTTSVGFADLEAALQDLEFEFDQGTDPGPLYKAVHTAVEACQRQAPELVQYLKQVAYVRATVTGCDDEHRLTKAMGGPPRMDSEYFRMLAVGFQITDDPFDKAAACGAWDGFRTQALSEKRLADNSVEITMLYLHMAELAATVPAKQIKEMKKHSTDEGLDTYFLFPDQLYERACLIDPQPGSFEKWHQHAAGVSVKKGEQVAQQWNKIRPGDLKPVLYLMQETAKRQAFPTALKWLEKAEGIDPVHPQVRAARFRLTAEGALRHLQQNKPKLAQQKLADLAAMPQAKQGQRPALSAALRYFIAQVAKDSATAATAFTELQAVLGDPMSARMFLLGIAPAPRLAPVMPVIAALSKEERAALPKCLATVSALGRDIGLPKVTYVPNYLAEASKQFEKAAKSLDVEQLRSLGHLAANTDNLNFAWAVSGAGLARGGASEAFFLWVRARALPRGNPQRFLAITAAAATLARLHEDSEALDRALGDLRHSGVAPPSLSPEQARKVIKTELASPAYPAYSRQGPSYSDILPMRGPFGGMDFLDDDEEDDFFEDDEDDDEGFFEGEDGDDDPDFALSSPGGLSRKEEDEIVRIFRSSTPNEIPSFIVDAMIGILREQLRSGMPPKKIIDQIKKSFLGPPPGRGPSPKKKPRGKKR